MGMVGCFAAVDTETMEKLNADPGLVEEYLYPDEGGGEPPHYIDVDKAWHGIHFMLTGSAESGPAPLCWAVLGGEEVGDDVGYGPARILRPDHVRKIARELASIDETAFKARFEPKAMEAAGIYPPIWVRDAEEALEYLVENYLKLVAFYRGAAARGDGAILWIA